MSVFPATHSERLAPGSFQQPVPIPAHLPGEPDLVQVCFNRDWLPYILGCLFQLTLHTTWQAATQADLDQVLGEANNLILIFQKALGSCTVTNNGTAGAGDDFMLRQDPDNPCLLQTSVDGMNWCTWADISKCNANIQPAQGTPPTPAGGGCTSYQGEVSIGDRWLLPNNVSTGDVITVSHANGLWSSPLDLFLPRCPDGNLWFELACVEGTGHTEGTDPAPAINHDSLIGWDGTNYYDFGAASDGMDVAITIAAGISQQPFYLMCNTPDTSGSGNVVFDVKYCNNAVATWTHTFDFVNNSGGFVPQADSGSAPAGVWTAGVGWESSDVTQAGGATFRRVHIRKTFVATTITSATAYFDLTKGTYTNPAVDYGLLVGLPDISGTAEINKVANDLSSASGQAILGSGVVAGQTSVEVYLSSCDDSGPFTGSCKLTRLTLTGTGPNPFGP